MLRVNRPASSAAERRCRRRRVSLCAPFRAPFRMAFRMLFHTPFHVPFHVLLRVSFHASFCALSRVLSHALLLEKQRDERRLLMFLAGARATTWRL